MDKRDFHGSKEENKGWFKPELETLSSRLKQSVEKLQSKFLGEAISGNPDVHPEVSWFNKLESFRDLASSVNSFLFSDTEAMQTEALDKLLASSQKNAGVFQSNLSFTEVSELLISNSEAVRVVFESKFGHFDFKSIDPAALFYLLEREDEVKNPSWKRRKHRFTVGASDDQVRRLHDWLLFADYSYYDAPQEILEALPACWKLVHCNLESLPGKPANYAAVKKGKTTTLLITARGTKSIADVFTDALMESVPYKGGSAHRGIVDSGRWLVNENMELAKNLYDTVNGNLKIVVVGHSLGASAATIAGMEFKDAFPDIEIEVVGFGCPAMLSQDLGEKVSSFVTTVVSDGDMIPRSSAETLANLAVTLLRFNYADRAVRDVNDALFEFHRRFPSVLGGTEVTNVANSVEKHLGQLLASKKSIVNTVELLKPELLPPGKILHIYRDGVGYSCSWTPPTFFDEIDVTRTMISDHLINGYNASFEGLLRKDQ